MEPPLGDVGRKSSIPGKMILTEHASRHENDVSLCMLDGGRPPNTELSAFISVTWTFGIESFPCVVFSFFHVLLVSPCWFTQTRLVCQYKYLCCHNTSVSEIEGATSLSSSSHFIRPRIVILSTFLSGCCVWNRRFHK